MRLIDSHCHLDFPDFANEIEAVVARAGAAGVERLVTIPTRVAHGERLPALAERFPQVYFTIGTHPHQAAEEAETDAAAIRAFAAHPKCVGIGEAGLDYHYNYAPRDVAAKVFRAQIGLARALDLPLVIHARDADDDVAAILREEMGKGAFKAVLHCFTSSRALAETGLALGLYVSFSGVLTFKNAPELRAAAAVTPLTSMLVETDAPFLTPHPFRGRANAPYLIPYTLRALADSKDVSETVACDTIFGNGQRIFGI